LDTKLLGPPVRWGRPGVPTILSFEQVLKIRTLQFLRDELRFPLQKVRKALTWLLNHLVEEEWHSLSLFRAGQGEIGVTDGEETYAIPTGQGILPFTLRKLNSHIPRARRDWDRRTVDIADFPGLISSARILGGSPVIRGTRIETAFVAHLAAELSLDELAKLFPDVSRKALGQAVRFEGGEYAA
jgi:uncharacterized protein (DUF433 family)